MVQSWLSPAQQSFIEDVERELKRHYNMVGKYDILVTDVKTEDWDGEHPYRIIDVHLSIDRDGDVRWDGYMPSYERSYWDNPSYVFEVTIPYSKIGNPIFIGGE